MKNWFGKNGIKQKKEIKSVMWKVIKHPTNLKN